MTTRYIFDSVKCTISQISRPELKSANNFNKFWLVTVHGLSDVKYTVARGHKDSPCQFVVWYPSGEFWSGYGDSITNAIKKAIYFKLQNTIFDLGVTVVPLEEIING